MKRFFASDAESDMLIAEATKTFGLKIGDIINMAIKNQFLPITEPFRTEARFILQRHTEGALEAQEIKQSMTRGIRALGTRPVRDADRLQGFFARYHLHEMREYLCGLFKEDYNVIEAGNGEEGVIMADKYIPKLIISDIMMPIKDGFECSQEIRENKRTFHIPVIFLTAKAEDADRLKSLQIGVDDYIMKPFNPELLKEKVKALIEQRDLLRKLYAKTLMLDEEVLESSEDVQDVFMPKMLQIIEENLSNRNFTIKVLTDKLNMSQPTLYRKVKQKTGLSIIEVIHGVRMSKAASIIMSGRYSSLTEVAEMVGYDSMISFRKQFVAQFGVLPSKYMEEKMRK